MPDRVGQQLGNYRLTHLLGQGGFAEVYLADHIHLNTQAAIKILHTRLVRDDIEPFRNEARTIARLMHPHIVRVLDFGAEGQTPFLIMEYAPNGTLRQRHPRDVALPLPTIVAYVKQVAGALQYAHNEKVIHRDIKPENMLVGRHNEILLSDFGIALIAQSSHSQDTKDIVGTVAYMAPEQIQGKPRPASDQYALGIVVYEWLSGSRPFRGSFTEIVTQHLTAPPPSLCEKIPTISQHVEQVVLTALEKDSHRRFASIQAFVNALEQASLSEQSQVSVSSTLQQPPQSPLPTTMQPPTVVPTNVISTQTPAPAVSDPVLPSVMQALAGSPTNVISTQTPAPGTPIPSQPVTPPPTVVPTNIISTQTPAPALSQSAPGTPTASQPMTQPKSRPSRRTLVDYLVPTDTRKASLLRDSLLTIGFSALFILFSQFSIHIPPFTPFPFTVRALIVLLIGAVLGSRRGTLAMLVAVLASLALPSAANGNTFTLLLLHQQSFLEAPSSGSGVGIALLSNLYLLKYLIAAFVTGWLCERGLDRNIRTSLLASLPGSLIIFLFSIASLVSTHQLSLFGLTQNWLRIIPVYLLSSLLAAALLLALWKAPQLIKRDIQ